MNSILDSIGDFFNTPSPQIDNPSELTKLISLPGSPIQQYGVGGALHNTLLGMINPHALGQPSMYEMIQAANNGDENARRQVAMNLAGSFTGMTDPVFHGTPAAPFEKFTNEAIGSGEGNQSYGYGHYLAGNPRVAKSYQINLSNGPKFIDENGNNLNNALDIAKSYYTPGTIVPSYGGFSFVRSYRGPEELQGQFGGGISPEIGVSEARPLNRNDTDLSDPSKWLIAPNTRYHSTIPVKANIDKIAKLRGWQEQEPGNFAQAKIGPEEDQFLDLDKPLNQQSDYIQNAINSIKNKLGITSSDMGATGIRLVKTLENNGDPSEVSNLLASAGIKGNKYLDATSRKSGEGSRNFVVFDPNDIEITHWNGVPVKEE